MTGLKFTVQVLQDYGYEIPQVGKNSCCLFHEEARPSARLYPEGGYHCWSAKCGVHFSDGLGAIMQLEQCGYKEAIEIAQKKYGFQATEAGPDSISLKEFYSIEEAITKMVTQQQPSLFISVYKTLDDLLAARDLDKMKKLYAKLASGDIR